MVADHLGEGGEAAAALRLAAHGAMEACRCGNTGRAIQSLADSAFILGIADTYDHGSTIPRGRLLVPYSWGGDRHEKGGSYANGLQSHS